MQTIKSKQKWLYQYQTEQTSKTKENYQKQKGTLHYNTVNPPRKYKQQSCTHKLDNLYEKDQFLKKYKLLQPPQYEIENSPITIKKIEFVIKNIPKRNLQAQTVSLEISTKCLRRINTNSI